MAINQPIKQVTMTPNGFGTATKTVKDGGERIREAIILLALEIFSKTHLLGSQIVKLQLTMKLAQGVRSQLVFRMRLVTGTLYGD